MTVSSELEWMEYKSRFCAVTGYGTYWIQANQTGSGYLLICGSNPCCGVFTSIQNTQLYAQHIHNNPDVRKAWFGLSDIEQTPYQVDNFAAWAQNLLAAWDQQYSCRQRDVAAKALSDKLLLAACFAGIAYDAAMSLPIMADKAPEFLLRIFLIALVDQNSSELDPYRAKNRPLPVTLTNEGTKPVDVAVVREALEDLELPIVGHLFVARGGATVRRVAGLEHGEDESSPLVRLSDVTKALEPFRALSPAEPVQGEQWQPIEIAPTPEAGK